MASLSCYFFLQLLLKWALGADKCLVPVLENGNAISNARSRDKPKYARNVRFNCRRDYRLMGSKYGHCVRGYWDVQIPVCTKPGCKYIRHEHMNGLFLESYRGAFIKVVCNPGYISSGPPAVYCNGHSWNGSFPYCLPKYANPAISCDFEAGDLCGWTIDPDNNHERLVISQAEEPMWDHTSTHSNSTLPQGTLKIYQMQEGESLESLIPDVWIITFEGSKWSRSRFLINKSEKNFQIVIEGSDGDIALDDFTIEFDEKCIDEDDLTSTSTSTELISTNTDPFDALSDFTCQGRCNQEAVLIGTNITADVLEETPKCDCVPNCLASHTCCQDYLQYCTTNDESTLSIISTTVLKEILPTASTHEMMSAMQSTVPNTITYSKNFSSKLHQDITASLTNLTQITSSGTTFSTVTYTSKEKKITTVIMIKKLTTPHKPPVARTTQKSAIPRISTTKVVTPKRRTTKQYTRVSIDTTTKKPMQWTKSGKTTTVYNNPLNSPNMTKGLVDFFSNKSRSGQSEMNAGETSTGLMVVKVVGGAGATVALVCAIVAAIIRRYDWRRHRHRHRPDTSRLLQHVDASNFTSSNEYLDLTLANSADSHL